MGMGSPPGAAVREEQEPDLESGLAGGHTTTYTVVTTADYPPEHEYASDEEDEVDAFGRVDNTATPLLLSLPSGGAHQDHARLLAQAYANERRLQEDLRAAGLL